MGKNFNVRVYGLFTIENLILVTDELIRGKKVTKFPGGGLEYGEGPGDCVIREFKEETGLKIKINSHFYTTDFFVASAFKASSQVISIYYNVQLNTSGKQNIDGISFNLSEYENSTLQFRWLPLAVISENDFTFVIDRKVASMLSEQKIIAL